MLIRMIRVLNFMILVNIRKLKSNLRLRKLNHREDKVALEQLENQVYLATFGVD